MTRLAGITAAALLLASGGQATVWAQGGKTPTFAPVPLTVLIEATVTPTAANPLGQAAIQGDGNGEYVHGSQDGTTATIDKYGNLIIAFGRPVYFSYGSPIPGTRSDPVQDEPPSAWHSGAYISTLGRAGEGPLQNVSGTSRCIKLNWHYDHPAGGWWRQGYNRGFDHNENGTSYAVVTRTGVNTWTVEPLGGPVCGITNPESTAAVFTQQSLKGKWVVRDYGDYVLPFKLTLTRKP